MVINTARKNMDPQMSTWSLGHNRIRRAFKEAQFNKRAVHSPSQTSSRCPEPGDHELGRVFEVSTCSGSRRLHTTLPTPLSNSVLLHPPQPSPTPSTAIASLDPLSVLSMCRSIPLSSPPLCYIRVHRSSTTNATYSHRVLCACVLSTCMPACMWFVCVHACKRMCGVCMCARACGLCALCMHMCDVCACTCVYSFTCKYSLQQVIGLVPGF